MTSQRRVSLSCAFSPEYQSETLHGGMQQNHGNDKASDELDQNREFVGCYL